MILNLPQPLVHCLCTSPKPHTKFLPLNFALKAGSSQGLAHRQFGAKPTNHCYYPFNRSGCQICCSAIESHAYQESQHGTATVWAVNNKVRCCSRPSLSQKAQALQRAWRKPWGANLSENVVRVVFGSFSPPSGPAESTAMCHLATSTRAVLSRLSSCLR